MPSSFLEKVRLRKEREVAARVAALSTDALRDRVEPTPRSFAGALSRPGARAILEVKRRSPSLGELRPGEDVGAVVADYRGAADAISVLVDEAFDGRLEDLAAARRHTDAPLLCKDFVLGPRQVLEARLHGADAVLLILSLIDDDTARVCLEQAEALGMDALVETHDADELARAIALGARVIGVNNRDLKTLEIDLARTVELAGLVPDDRVLITESGVSSPADVERLAPLVDGFLIGSALMKAGAGRFDAARALTFGRLKVCGLTRSEDAALADSLGARFGGVVLADSPRRASVEQAIAVAEAAPKLPLVAVFRKQPAEEVLSATDRLVEAGVALAAVQLHGGDELPEVARGVQRGLDERGETVQLWVARGIEVASAGEERHAKAPRRQDLFGQVDRFVLDAAHRGQSGGTGLTFAWSSVDEETLAECVLAGGLKPENVRAARATGAWALDASSGLEDSPGIKSEARLRAFFEVARPASRRDQEVPEEGA